MPSTTVATTAAMARSGQSTAGPEGSFLRFSFMRRERAVWLIGPQTCHNKGRQPHLRNKVALRPLLAVSMDITALAVLRPLLLTQTEELIGGGEQNLTRASIQLDRHLTAGWPVQGARDLLLGIKDRLAKLHGRR
jgi:hypothetical protein